MNSFSPVTSATAVMDAARRLRDEWGETEGCPDFFLGNTLEDRLSNAEEVVEAITAYDEGIQAMADALKELS